MRKQQAYSYGVIPIYKETNSWWVLLIKQKNGQTTEYWTFPKGTPEAGELPLETAVRETAEEVGIHFNSVKNTPTFVTDFYTFERDNVLIEKSVTYYLGFTDNRSFTIQESEVAAADWFTLVEAKEKLTFTTAKNILTKVAAHLS